MQDCLKKEPKTKTRKLCEVTGISKSTFYYNKDNDSQELKDKEILDLLLKLPKKILRNRRSKAKAHEIKIRFGKVVNHFCCLLEFYHTFLLLCGRKFIFLYFYLFVLYEIRNKRNGSIISYPAGLSFHIIAKSGKFYEIWLQYNGMC